MSLDSQQFPSHIPIVFCSSYYVYTLLDSYLSEKLLSSKFTFKAKFKFNNFPWLKKLRNL